MAMKINTKLRYGLRMLLTLAENPDRVRSTADLGEAMKVSPKYLRKLAGPLEKAGLIGSVQGIYGGYRLQRPPHEISILMLFAAFDEKSRDRRVVFAEWVTQRPREPELVDLFIRLKASLEVRQRRITKKHQSLELAQTRTSVLVPRDYPSRPADVLVNTDAITMSADMRDEMRRMIAVGYARGQPQGL